MSPSDVVVSFLAECGRSKEAMQEAMRSYFTSETVWENVNMGTTVGADEALALMQSFEDNTGIATFRATLINKAVDGNVVLTERTESLVDAEGKQIMEVRIMGAFEIEGDKIVAWRDYFDTKVYS